MITPSVFLDLDDVLVDFTGGVLRDAGIDPSRRAEVSEWGGQSIARLLNCDSGTMWRVLAADNFGLTFWRDLAWLEHGRDLFARLVDTASVTIMSAPCHDPNSAAGKVAWMQREIPSHARRYALTPCKSVFARPGAILVDDGEHNVEAFRLAGGRAFLWPATWNSYRRAPQASDVDRCVASIASAFRRPA